MGQAEAFPHVTMGPTGAPPDELRSTEESPVRGLWRTPGSESNRCAWTLSKRTPVQWVNASCRVGGCGWCTVLWLVGALVSPSPSEKLVLLLAPLLNSPTHRAILKR